MNAFWITAVLSTFYHSITGAKVEKCFAYKHNSNSTFGTKFNYCLIIQTNGNGEAKISKFMQKDQAGNELKLFQKNGKLFTLCIQEVGQWFKLKCSELWKHTSNTKNGRC